MLGSFLDLIREVVFLVAYISGNSFEKQLSADEERMLIEQHMHGDSEARRKLIEHNLRLVAFIAHKYSTSGQEEDDLVSVGSIGLIKAVNTFKPNRGTQLGTYAGKCIENEILMSIRAAKKKRKEVSLEEPVGTDREGNVIALLDILGCDADMVPDAVNTRLEVSKLLGHMTRALSQRDRMILQMRYGLNGQQPLPQREIASRLGISRSYVSRIENRAVEKLRRELGMG